VKRFSRYLPFFFCLLLASSCSSAGEDVFGKKKGDSIDPELGLSRTDYKNMLDEKYMSKTSGSDQTNPSEPPIPDLAEILATPDPPKLAETKLVSVAVTEDVPLKDVLIEVARLADVDIEVDSSITGGISFRAKDRPFNEVIERIADLAGLRYSTKNNVLRVERDTPYIQIYSLDLLNMERTSQGNIGVNTGTSGSGGGGGAGGGNAYTGGVTSGSTSTITAKTDSDFWKQFEESVQKILTYEETSRISGANLASQINQANRAPTPVNYAATDYAMDYAAAGYAAPNQKPGNAPAGQPNAAGGAQNKAPATRPVAVAAGDGGAVTHPAATPGKSFYVLNRQASTLTVSATDKQHKILKRFISKIEDNASAQVLIEAKIVEVTLSDIYQSGIDWSFLNKNAGFNMKASTPTANASSFTSFALNKSNVAGSFDLTSAVKLVEQFGVTRTLSSPRLHATNNQQAVLTFADNLVFFELKFDITDAVLNTSGGITQPAKTKVTSTIHTVPIGILLSLQPSINTEKGEVTLSVRPTLSRILSYTEDPSVPISLASAGITNLNIKSLVPVVEVRELDSILKVKSGEVMVIGGLMESKNINTDVGAPGISSVPYLGNFFKSVDKSNTSKELVIFIRATIVGTNGNASPSDKNFYNKFTQDPRPLFNKDSTDAPAEDVPNVMPEPTPQAVEKTTAAPLWPAPSDVPVVDIPPPSPVAVPKPTPAYNDFPESVPEIPPLAPLVHQ